MDLLLRRRMMIAAQSSDIVEVPYVRTNSGAYIDTGLRGYSSTTVDISFKMNRAYADSNGHAGVFGFEQSRYSGSTVTYYPGFAIFMSNGTSSWMSLVKYAEYGHDTDSDYTTEKPFQTNGEYDVVLSRTGCTISGSYSHTYTTWASDAWNKQDSGTKKYYNYSTKSTMTLGCVTYYGKPAGYTGYGYFVTYVDVNIYHCKIWQGNSLMRDYVPAFSKSENKYGLYDKVNKTFSSSFSSTGFTYQ